MGDMKKLKELAEKELGFEVSGQQFLESEKRAREKLCRIIRRYGDADGRRQGAEYLARLVCEDIKACVRAEAAALMAVTVHSMEKGHPADCQGTHTSTCIVAWKCR